MAVCAFDSTGNDDCRSRTNAEAIAGETNVWKFFLGVRFRAETNDPQRLTPARWGRPTPRGRDNVLAKNTLHYRDHTIGNGTHPTRLYTRLKPLFRRPWSGRSRPSLKVRAGVLAWM
jgi:hypothetical protein